MPNCLHGSSTSNIHFHGTHTTPNTTGDNILLFVRPALQQRGRSQRHPARTPRWSTRQFAQVWADCEKNGSPTAWEQLPEAWRADQERLLQAVRQDRAVPGAARQAPARHAAVAGESASDPAGRVAAVSDRRVPVLLPAARDPKTNTMGQAPGTHWYHAHKHGSTALNVANGMTGAFVIEGQYDDDLRRFYGAELPRSGAGHPAALVHAVSRCSNPNVERTRARCPSRSCR